MTKDEALKLALEALEEAWYHVGTFQPTEKAIDLYDEARTAIKEALAQPEQEPVKYWIASHKYVFDSLYTTPPQIKGCAECGVNDNNHALYCVACAERYLKAKNT